MVSLVSYVFMFPYKKQTGDMAVTESREGMDIFIIISKGLHPAQTKIFREGGLSWSEAGWSQATRLAKQNEK